MLYNTDTHQAQTQFQTLFANYTKAVEVCLTDPDYRLSTERAIARCKLERIQSLKPDFWIEQIQLCIKYEIELKQIISGCKVSQLQCLEHYNKLIEFCINSKYNKHV